MKNINYPHLKKIGGLLNFAKKTIFRILIITLIATLAGYLSGSTIQRSFRDLTGYMPEAQLVTETKEEEPKTAGLIIQHMADAVKDSASDLVYRAIDPPLKAMDWAAFWFSFALAFITGAWLTNKLIALKSHVLTGGVDPTIIRNMEILEAKVNELVDISNEKVIQSGNRKIEK